MHAFIPEVKHLGDVWRHVDFFLWRCHSYSFNIDSRRWEWMHEFRAATMNKSVVDIFIPTITAISYFRIGLVWPKCQSCLISGNFSICNIFTFLSSRLNADSVHLHCWPNKMFEDIILGFGSRFIPPTPPKKKKQTKTKLTWKKNQQPINSFEWISFICTFFLEKYQNHVSNSGLQAKSGPLYNYTCLIFGPLRAPLVLQIPECWDFFPSISLRSLFLAPFFLRPSFSPFYF